MQTLRKYLPTKSSVSWFYCGSPDSPLQTCKTADWVMNIRQTETKKCAEEDWTDCCPLSQINIGPQADTFESKQIVCVSDYVILCDVNLEFPAAFNQSVSPFEEGMTSTCITAPSFVVPVQLYLCYESFTHVISVYVNLNLKAPSKCGTRVAPMASIWVLCCAESCFTHIKSCQQFKGTPEVLSVTRSWKFISTYWFSHT